MAKIQQTGAVATYSLHKFRVLLAEDYDFMQHLAAGMLRAFGVGDVIVCSGGHEAKATLDHLAKSSNLVDIVITDWLMPEGNGNELTRWIRDHKEEDIRFLPVLTVSSYTSKDMIEQARDAGANESLVKPLSGEKLAKRILSIIDAPRSFIKTPDFFGPDRRRHAHPWQHAERRKINPETIKVNNEQA